MPEHRLTHAVIDLTGRELLPAGTLLTMPVLQTLAGEHKTDFPACDLLDYGQVHADMLYFFEVPPYDVIFHETERQQTLFDIAGDVVMPETLLTSLYHFRQLDFYTYRHMLLVFALSILIGRELIHDRAALLQEVMAGPIHDIGKLCVPLPILTKKTALTSSEIVHLRHHALAGYVLLTHFFREHETLAARVARDHHERKNGSGYPSGNPIDNLMIDIIMVSDVYDALISPRPYRPMSYDNRTALEEITRQAVAGIISQTVARVLISLNRRSKPHYSCCTLSSERRGAPPQGNLYGRMISDSNDHAQ
ncbi:MAG: HD domain-containing protein [Desulfotignum sp.]|nr:HD domain-containing protein [Desulfotignum sp.]MCF8088306.1 HD domain-containing protein [Desulfotignum sp.]MCF8137690.1 HD domain-containing protein [Desulfotignum sp.]